MSERGLIRCASCGTPAVVDGVSYCDELLCKDCFESKIKEIEKENVK